MEKLYYFLSLKKKYSNMLIYLQEIHYLYNSILDIHEANNKLDEYNLIYNKILNISEEISETKNFLYNIEKDIQDNCDHNFVDDVIDIHPDKSVNIKYCTICEFTCEL